MTMLPFLKDISSTLPLIFPLDFQTSHLEKKRKEKRILYLYFSAGMNEGQVCGNKLSLPLKPLLCFSPIITWTFISPQHPA